MKQQNSIRPPAASNLHAEPRPRALRHHEMVRLSHQFGVVCSTRTETRTTVAPKHQTPPRWGLPLTKDYRLFTHTKEPRPHRAARPDRELPGRAGEEEHPDDKERSGMGPRVPELTDSLKAVV